VLGAEPIETGLSANACWRLELGPSREGAYFKPVNGVNLTVASMLGHTRQSVLLSELSAYRLARALGTPFADIVPPCVLRHVPEVDDLAPGSLTGERFDLRETSVFEGGPALALRAAFFDSLIGNQDRSRSNLLFDASRDELALIDHGFAFRRDADVVVASVLVDWRRRAGLDAITDVECEVLERLLGEGELFGLRRYLDADRADALETRAERIRHAGRLV
jgi:hypothetical protein